MGCRLWGHTESDTTEVTQQQQQQQRTFRNFPGGSDGKASVYNAGDLRSLGLEGSLEKGMDTHFSILAWRIPWTEEPGRLQSMVLLRVGHD